MALLYGYKLKRIENRGGNNLYLNPEVIILKQKQSTDKITCEN
ncbi:MAG TPA: hypothetical protein PLC80_15775 [Draconibacterium sp.]|jgi:hypothetical protein|nr:hypothetical protein [Draconibacterium sp.]